MKAPVILLAEDNPHDEALVLRALSQSSIRHQVVVIRDGAQALDYLFARGAYADRDRTDLPAVMFLDLKLPKIDGLEVLRRVRADAVVRLLPIVILTSSVEEEDRLRGYALGANSYVRKPIAFVELATAVRRLELYWLQLNEPPPRPAG